MRREVLNERDTHDLNLLIVPYRTIFAKKSKNLTGKCLKSLIVQPFGPRLSAFCFWLSALCSEPFKLKCLNMTPENRNL